MRYRLLDAFDGLFRGKVYKHRNPTLGDFVSYHLYEDLYALGRSQTLVKSVDARQRVLCVANRARGKKTSRRGDGTFGELLPGIKPQQLADFVVTRGPVASVEIGVEAKILSTAMVKQVGRVITDLQGQLTAFRLGGTDETITVGLVGINQAASYTSYEGNVRCPKCGEVFRLSWPTNGTKERPHPSQEAGAVEAKVLDDARPGYDEFLVLRYRATNTSPFPFEWVNYDATFKDYGALLLRVSSLYQRRFGDQS